MDDIFILMALFSQVGSGIKLEMQRKHIVAGQHLGFAALVALSIVGALISIFIPVPWIVHTHSIRYIYLIP